MAVTGEPIRVLLVEDNPDDVTLVRLALGKSIGGFDVESVGRLDAARARVRASGIDLVLLDLSLPDRSGLEAFADLHAEVPETPVIVMAGSDDEGLAIRAVQDGAKDYLLKGSIDADGLRRAIRYAVEHDRMRQRIRELATVDELTGLLNVRGFTPLAEHHLRLARRTGQPVTLLFVDLDNMNAVNEAFGRAEGSRLLVDTATVLRQAVRESDVLARTGGDEFSILLTGSDPAAAATVLTRLVEAIATHNARSGRPYQLSLSVGAETYDPERPCTLDELIRRASQRMREARAGKPSSP